MSRPCKELKRIARENLTRHYRIPMGALLVTYIIPLAIELPFSMIQGEEPSLLQNITFYAAEFLIILLRFVLAAGVVELHLNMARKKNYSVKMVFSAFRDRPDRYILIGIFMFLAMLTCMLPIAAGLAITYGKEGNALYPVLGACSVISLILTVFMLLALSLTLYIAADNAELSAWGCLKKAPMSCVGTKGGFSISI